MIETIVAWVKGIVFVTVFATFLELLLPSSSMQKFVRVIMGLLIMLAILNPIMGYLERIPGGTDVAVLAPQSTGSDIIEKTAQAALRKRDAIVKEMYCRDVAKQMQSLVMNVDGVADARVTVESAETKNGLMTVKQVTVEVIPGISKGAVQKVAIGRLQAETPQLREETVAKIQLRLSELYQLRAQQILVKPMVR